MQRTIAAMAWATVWIATRSYAQPAPSEADQLFEAGRQLADHGDYAGACEKFAKSYQLDPALGTELNLAVCYEHLDRLRDAWALYLAASLQAQREGETKRSDFAREHADTIAARLATIVLDVSYPLAGTTITIAGHPVAAQREVSDRVDPGDVEIVATAPGEPEFRKTVHAVVGNTLIIRVPERAVVGVPQPALGPSRRRVHLAWGLATGAGASVVTALVLGGIARDDYNGATSDGHCSHQAAGLVCDGVGGSEVHHAQSLADVSTGFALGAVALGALASYFYLTAPREPTLAPVVTRNSAALTYTGSF